MTLAPAGPQVRPPARPGWSGHAPASTRPPVCRRSGCAAPAGDDGLCAGHQARQLAARAAVEARPRPDSGRGVPVPAWLLAAAVDRGAPWRALAACRGQTAVMFPSATGSGHPAPYAAALALCATCPVVGPCRDAGALEPHGVWGGTTPADRGLPARRRA